MISIFHTRVKRFRYIFFVKLLISLMLTLIT